MDTGKYFNFRAVRDARVRIYARDSQKGKLIEVDEIALEAFAGIRHGGGGGGGGDRGCSARLVRWKT